MGGFGISESNKTGKKNHQQQHYTDYAPNHNSQQRSSPAGNGSWTGRHWLHAEGKDRTWMPWGQSEGATWDSSPNCGMAREREKGERERERELSRQSSNLRHSQTCSQNKELNKHQRSVSWLRTGPSPAGGREAGRWQPDLEGEGIHLSPRDGILHQTVSRLLVANQVFLGSWMVDIHQEGRSQRSAPQKKNTGHAWEGALTAHLGNRGPGTQGVIRRTVHLGECTRRAPGRLSCLDLGRAQHADPTESLPLWRTWEPEPEWLRPGKCTQPRARFKQFPCRATWSLSSVDWKNTHGMSRGKASVAQTLWALPTHASGIC